MSPEGKRYAFAATAVVILALGAGGVVALITGDWQWVAAGAIGLLGAAIFTGVIIGIYALAERLFPDR